MNGAHQSLVYADELHLLGENINYHKTSEALLEASGEAGLEVNAQKITYMVMSRHHNAGQNHNLMRAKNFFRKFGEVRIFADDSCISFTNKLRTDKILGKLAATRFRIFCLPVSSPKTSNIKMFKSVILPAFFVDVKFDLSY
jgi:hypothetical protein